MKVTQASRSLAGHVTALERSARQYAVAGEAHVPRGLPRPTARRSRACCAQLDAMALSDDQRAELAAHRAPGRGDPPVPHARGPHARRSRMHLAREFAQPRASAPQALVRLGDQVIDEGIEQLRTQAVQSRNSVFWLMIALIPTAVLLIASFTFLIAQPDHAGERGHPRAGRGPLRASPIRIEGPGDMVRLGEQLDWLRERLVTLEAQKTRFLQHISHELKTPLTALREGSDLLSSGVVGNLNAEQREIARILQENSIELRKLIEGLLNYSAVHAQASYLDAKIVPLQRRWCAAWSTTASSPSSPRASASSSTART